MQNLLKIFFTFIISCFIVLPSFSKGVFKFNGSEYKTSTNKSLSESYSEIFLFEDSKNDYNVDTSQVKLYFNYKTVDLLKKGLVLNVIADGNENFNEELPNVEIDFYEKIWDYQNQTGYLGTFSKTTCDASLKILSYLPKQKILKGKVTGNCSNFIDINDQEQNITKEITFTFTVPLKKI